MTTKLTSMNPSFARLVDRQMRNWELARRQRLSQPAPARAEVEDFLCVSKQVGVDYEKVASRLGERLGWPVFDREILDVMAGDDKLRREIYASMESRDLSWWEETLRSLMQGEFVKNDYFHRLCESVLSLARQGSCVFLGRGADLVLPDDRGFRVRLVAPIDLRVELLAAKMGLEPAAAEAQIRVLDGQRDEFFRHHFRVDANDPLRHDVSINLAGFSIEQATDLILEARRIFFSERAGEGS